MDAGEELPELRTIPEILVLMEGVAAECEAGVDPARVSPLFDDALRLSVEIRVPRMPDSEEELARMLDAARKGPTYTTDEVFAHLEEARTRTELLRARFRDHLASGRTTDAARMLSPDSDAMISWERDVTVSTRRDGGWFATATSACGDATCRADDEGLARLGVVMRLHALRDLWLR